MILSTDSKEMPWYRCHKVVQALKIRDVMNLRDGRGIIAPQEEGFRPFIVSTVFMQKHDPKEGGYYVVYKDGYQSYSPAEAFEDGYEQI